jgi:hypothetical protein
VIPLSALLSLTLYFTCNSQTQPWLTEEGMPMRGLVNITYYSGEGQGKKGCRPYISFRKALLNLVRAPLAAYVRIVVARALCICRVVLRMLL